MDNKIETVEKKVEETAAKAAETVKKASKPAAKKTAAKKTTAKKTAAKKTTVKKAETTAEPKKRGRKPAAKTAAKKTTAAATEKKSTVKPNVVLQYGEKSVTFDTLLQNARNVWQYDMGRKTSEIKELNLYVKPEEDRVYFVVNNTETGDFGL